MLSSPPSTKPPPSPVVAAIVNAVEQTEVDNRLHGIEEEETARDALYCLAWDSTISLFCVLCSSYWNELEVDAVHCPSANQKTFVQLVAHYTDEFGDSDMLLHVADTPPYTYVDVCFSGGRRIRALVSPSYSKSIARRQISDLCPLVVLAQLYDAFRLQTVGKPVVQQKPSQKPHF